MKIHIIPIIAGLLALSAPTVQAIEIEISGYASFAATMADATDDSGNDVAYLNGLATKNPSFDTSDSIIGLQFSSTISKELDITLVLQADGGSSNYDVTAEWAYATYKFNEELSLRMGKYKGSFYMVSDYQDVGYAYPWARPPQEVYSTNPIKALSGLNLVFQTDVGNNLALLTELYVGSGTHSSKYIPSTTDDPATGLATSLNGQSINFDTVNTSGFNLSLAGDIATFRIGYFDTDVTAAAFNITEKPGTFLGFGFNLDWKDVVIYSEYIQRDTDPTLAGAFPDQNAYYVTLGYRFNKYLPYVTYASIEEGKDASPYAQLQSSVALGLRTEITDSAALKIEILSITPEKNPLAGFNTSSSGYGLFNAPVDSGTVATIKFDLIF
ncbi:MAG: hypothetical protein QM484_05435 [Woeseiaceae bacterium]